jgi:pimeloyl-ACP methyl ester carboxylesterase
LAESREHREETVELRTGSIRLLRGGGGDPLVLLHHSTGPLGWTPFCEHLAESFSVIAPDLPGYGSSERPDWAREPRDLAILSWRALERLGLERVVLVGTGFGGFIAAEMAIMNAPSVASLVLCGAAGLQPERGEILDQMMISHDAYVRAGFRDDAAHDAVFGAHADDEIRNVWDLSREMTARVSWKPYMFDRRLPALLGLVETPTLLLWGGADRVVPPECGEQYARSLPNATLEILPEAGHLLELEEPARAAELIVAHARKALASR